MKALSDIWSHIPEHINPVIFSFGSLQIRWYGTMYLLPFLVVYFVAVYRIKSENLNYTKKTVRDVLLWTILGCIIGGRLGYVLFYNFKYFLANPLKIFLPVNISSGDYEALSGLSYHGGLVGILLAGVIFCYKNKIDFWQLLDIIILGIPLGYTIGRLGNFINGELYGRVTTLPWGMYFPLDPTHQLRHPSQLYEAFFEGVFLFAILWYLRKIKWFDGFLFSMYLIGYGLSRFFIEFVRLPDPHLGYILGPFTMGQILCFGMILASIIIILIRGHAIKYFSKI
jgi:phosphatidylglycerol:prolipoprotein diacylglycerol transferase